MSGKRRYPLIILNPTIPFGMTLNPNPNNFKVVSKKVYSQTQTLGGWIYEHAGEAPKTLTVTGVTTPIVGGWDNELDVESAFFTLKQLYHLDKQPIGSISARLQNLSLVNLLKSLDPFVKALLSNTSIYYRHDIYNGFFTSLTWENLGEQPRIYRYSFEFLVTSTGQNYLADKLPPFLVLGAANKTIQKAVGTVVNMIPGIPKI